MTITRTTRPDGTVEISYSSQDELRMRAILYQQKRGLSMSKDAIRASMKWLSRQQEQNYATGVELPFEGRIAG